MRLSLHARSLLAYFATLALQPPSEGLESGVVVAHFLEVVRTKYNFNANVSARDDTHACGLGGIWPYL